MQWISLIFEDGTESKETIITELGRLQWGKIRLRKPLTFGVEKGSTVTGCIIRDGKWHTCTKLTPEHYKVNGTYTLTDLEIVIQGSHNLFHYDPPRQQRKSLLSRLLRRG